jgi:carbamate kinase
MLTDAKFLYKDWGKPTQARVDVLDVANMSPEDQKFVDTLEAGSMQPKV